MSSSKLYKLKPLDFIISIILFIGIYFITENSYSNTSIIIARILILICVFIVVFDIILYLNKSENDTISNIIRDWVNNRLWLIISFWGILAGHFFLGEESQLSGEHKISYIGLILLFQLALGFKFEKISIVMKILVLLIGVAIGHYIWPQS